MATIAEMTFQGGGLRDQDIAQGAGIGATKVIHQTTMSELLFGPTTNVANVTAPLFICNAETAELVDFDVALFGAMTTGDRTVTVDLQKSTGAGAFATIMSTPVELNDTNAARLAVSGVIADVDLIAGDIIQVVVTLGGSSGTLAQGLLVSLTTRDRPIV